MIQIIDDFDIGTEEIQLHVREENLNKISRLVRELKVNLLSRVRSDKKLLVLDFDYINFDHVLHAKKGASIKGASTDASIPA